ncbi:hypothetical protein ONZ45_g16822 [Pleurotus djamor]|nr:hypothetical protein ONZ45_g16822 [Pleurotus djamor]
MDQVDHAYEAEASSSAAVELHQLTVSPNSNVLAKSSESSEPPDIPKEEQKQLVTPAVHIFTANRRIEPAGTGAAREVGGRLRTDSREFPETVTLESQTGSLPDTGDVNQLVGTSSNDQAHTPVGGSGSFDSGSFYHQYRDPVMDARYYEKTAGVIPIVLPGDGAGPSAVVVDDVGPVVQVEVEATPVATERDQVEDVRKELVDMMTSFKSEINFKLERQQNANKIQIAQVTFLDVTSRTFLI